MINRETIKQTRLELGFKQVDVAIALKVSEHTVSLWERGAQKPSKMHEQKLKKFFKDQLAKL